MAFNLVYGIPQPATEKPPVAPQPNEPPADKRPAPPETIKKEA